jgi:hypothetical protein
MNGRYTVERALAIISGKPGFCESLRPVPVEMLYLLAKIANCPKEYTEII